MQVCDKLGDEMTAEWAKELAERVKAVYQRAPTHRIEQMQQLFLSLHCRTQELVVNQMGDVLCEVMNSWPIAMQHVRSLLERATVSSFVLAACMCGFHRMLTPAVDGQVNIATWHPHLALIRFVFLQFQSLMYCPNA